jgi:hypothetical protein
LWARRLSEHSVPTIFSALERKNPELAHVPLRQGILKRLQALNNMDYHIPTFFILFFQNYYRFLGDFDGFSQLWSI